MRVTHIGILTVHDVMDVRERIRMDNLSVQGRNVHDAKTGKILKVLDPQDELELRKTGGLHYIVAMDADLQIVKPSHPLVAAFKKSMKRSRPSTATK